MRMITVNHWTEHVNPNGRVRASTVRAEGDCNPIGRTAIPANWTLPNLPGTKALTKDYT